MPEQPPELRKIKDMARVIQKRGFVTKDEMRFFLGYADTELWDYLKKMGVIGKTANLVENIRAASLQVGRLPPDEEEAFWTRYYNWLTSLYTDILVTLKSNLVEEYITLTKLSSRQALPPSIRVLGVSVAGKKVEENRVRMQNYYLKGDLVLAERRIDEGGNLHATFKFMFEGFGTLFHYTDNPMEIIGLARKGKIVPAMKEYSKLLKVYYGEDLARVLRGEAKPKVLGVFYVLTHPSRLLAIVGELAAAGIQPLAVGRSVALYPAIAKLPLRPEYLAYKTWSKLSEKERQIILGVTCIFRRLSAIAKRMKTTEEQAWDKLSYKDRLEILEECWDMVPEDVKKTYLVEVEIPLLVEEVTKLLFPRDWRLYAGGKMPKPVHYASWVPVKPLIRAEQRVFLPKYIVDLLRSPRSEDKLRGIAEAFKFDPYITYKHLELIARALGVKIPKPREVDLMKVGDYVLILTRTYPASLFNSYRVKLYPAKLALELTMKEPPIRPDILSPSKIKRARWDRFTEEERKLITPVLKSFAEKNMVPESIKKYIDMGRYDIAWNLLPEKLRVQVAMVLKDELSGVEPEKAVEEAKEKIERPKPPPLDPDTPLCEWERYLFKTERVCRLYERNGIRTISDYIKAIVAYMKAFYDIGLIKRPEMKIKELISILLPDALFGGRTVELGILHERADAWLLLELLKRLYKGEYDTKYVRIGLAYIDPPSIWEEKKPIEKRTPPKPLLEVLAGDEELTKAVILAWRRIPV